MGVYYSYKKTAGVLPKRNRTFKAKGLIVSGGVLGTLKLLLHQKYIYKTLPNLSDKLGESVRTNSEILCTATLSDQKLNNSIAISSIFKPDKDTFIEIVKYPNKSNVMRNLLTMAIDKKGSESVRIFQFFGKIFKNPILFFRMAFNRNWAENTVVFLVMQTLDNKMSLKLKKWPFHKKLTLSNNQQQKVPSYIPVGQDVMRRFAKKANAKPQNSTLEILFDIPSTAHILGGNPMGESATDGVINKNFEVFNYPNFYILDGSVVQGNLGVNPSFTITALGEYAMSKIPEKETVVS